MTHDDREWLESCELERQERIATAGMAIIYRSRYDAKGNEIHNAEIVESDRPDMVVFDQFTDTDDLEALMDRARSKRDELAVEIAKREMKSMISDDNMRKN